YRYHHLFAHLLQNQLRQEQPQLVSSLHEQAGRWFLYHDDDEYQREGLYHLLAAESWTAACELLEQQLEQWLWSRGELTAVLNWLEQIPDEVLAQHPSLLTWKAVSLSLTAQIGRSQHYLNLLKPDENNSRWQGYIAFVHSSNAMSTDQPALSVQYAQDALEFLPADAHKLRSLILQNLGLAFRLSDDAPAAERTFQQAAALAQECHNRPSLFNAYIQLGDLALQLGDLPQAEMYYQRVIEPAEQNPALSYMPQVAFAYGAYSYVLYNRNQLDEAYALVQKGIQLVSRIPNGQLQHDAPILLCGILAARQQWPEAQAVLDQAIATAQAHETDMRLERFEMYRARLHIQMGELTTAEAWLAKLPLTPNDPIHFKNRFDFFTLLRLRLAQKRLTEAEQILNRLETTLPNGRS
ncbi:MAG: tetratricopeptide repeat protein, partial [Anaerolineales bacterium]|nr:tetratricopeptide repeat protein [Anaerolineales bacterium]